MTKDEIHLQPTGSRKKSAPSKAKTNSQNGLRTILEILNIIVLIISLGANIYLASVNNGISQQNLELQKITSNYSPFVTGFQQEMAIAKYETQSGTMKAKIIIISPHSGYYNITLVNFTLIQENLDMSHQNGVGLEQEIAFHTTAPGANSFDENIALWTIFFPSSDYLPPKAQGARIPVARLLLELVYQDTQTENTTRSQFPGNLWLAINMTSVQ